jgi:hypothetical protein
MREKCAECGERPATITVTVLETFPKGAALKLERRYCHTCCPVDLIEALELHGEEMVP